MCSGRDSGPAVPRRGGGAGRPGFLLWPSPGPDASADGPSARGGGGARCQCFPVWKHRWCLLSLVCPCSDTLGPCACTTSLTVLLCVRSEPQHQPAVAEAEDHVQGLHQQGTPGAGPRAAPVVFEVCRRVPEATYVPVGNV